MRKGPSRSTVSDEPVCSPWRTGPEQPKESVPKRVRLAWDGDWKENLGATEEHVQKGPHRTSLPHLLHLGKLLKLKNHVPSKLPVSTGDLFQLLTRQDANPKSYDFPFLVWVEKVFWGLVYSVPPPSN